MTQKKHNRVYVPGGTALRVGQLMHTADIDRQEYIEKVVLRSQMLTKAPFDTIYHHYYYGFETNLNPQSRISKKYNDIRVTIELDMDILEWADRYNIKLFMEMMGF